MVTSLEQLWYVLSVGLLAILIGIIRWGVLRIMTTFDRLESAIKSLETAVSVVQQGCVLKHQPISKDIDELKKKAIYHSKKLSEHDVEISILQQKK